jgi:hypothetical protein
MKRKQGNKSKRKAIRKVEGEEKWRREEGRTRKSNRRGDCDQSTLYAHMEMSLNPLLCAIQYSDIN